MAAPAQSDIVRELYGRRDSLPADKRAVVEELYGRMNPQTPANPAKASQPADFRTIMASPEFQKGAVAPFKGGAKAIAQGAYDSVVQGGGPITQAAGYLSGADKKVQQATTPRDTGEQAGSLATNAAMLAQGVEALAPSTIKAVGKVVSRIRGNPVGAPTTPSLPGPYFNERSTIDPQMHGATPPAGPPTTTGTVNVPPVTQPEPPGVNTRGAAGRVNPTARPDGAPPTGTVNVPPTPQPTGMTQNARGPLASPVTAKPPSQVYVGSSGTIPGKITTEAPAAPTAPSTKLLDDIAKGMAGKKFSALSPEQQKAASTLADRIGAATPQTEAVVKPSTPSPNGTLRPPVTANTAESYTKKALDEIMKKAAEGDPEGNQTGAYTGDRGEHKALNVARYLNKQGISADAYQSMLDAAKKTGDWSAIDNINAKAYETGKAGEYAGFLPKRSYDPVVPAVGSGEITPRATFKGKSTPQLIIDHLKELDKLRK